MFENQLIESQRKKQGAGRRSMTFVISLIVHAVIIGGAVAASLWFVEAVPEPPIPVQFYMSAPPPPPPPPPAPKAAPKPQQKVEPVKPTQVTVPTAIPDVIPKPLPAPEPVDTGVQGGVEGGVEGGVPGGVLGGTPGGTGRDLGAPLRVGGNVKAPIRTSYSEPVYPDAARKARMQGIVILQAIINAQGEVVDVEVLKSVNPLLDASAERAVRQWKYRPATLNGRAVSVYLTVTVNFNLH